MCPACLCKLTLPRRAQRVSAADERHVVRDDELQQIGARRAHGLLPGLERERSRRHAQRVALPGACGARNRTRACRRTDDVEVGGEAVGGIALADGNDSVPLAHESHGRQGGADPAERSGGSFVSYTDRQSTPNGQRSTAVRRARHIHTSMLCNRTHAV